jgi:acetyltransferase EpsM
VEKLFICGAGGHAKVVADIAHARGNFETIGVVVPKNAEVEIDSVDVFEEDEFLRKIDGEHVFIAVGENITRKRIFEKFAGKNVSFPNLIHPSAVISGSVTMGGGNVVMPNVVMNAASNIGNQCVFNTSSSLGHDCSVGDFVSLAPQAIICGNCLLEDGAYVGANASVIHSKKIGRWSVIGAQAAVVKDIEEFNLVSGVPAELKRKIHEDEKIL